MTHNLREVTNAIWKSGPKAEDEEEGVKLYERARMLRDKGLIQSSQPRAQGRAMMLSDADVAAAVVAIMASLNGASWGQIGVLNQDLRNIDNTQGKPEFERLIENIRAGELIFARLDIIAKAFDGASFGYSRAIMGTKAEVSFEAVPLSKHTTQVMFWPVTDLVTPVLGLLDESEATR